MQVLLEDKQQVLKCLRTHARYDHYLWFPLGMSFSLQNLTKVHPDEMRYYLIWPPTQFSARTIRFHYRTIKVWAAMCSIFSLQKIILARRVYTLKESNIFPSVKFNNRYYLSDTDILLENFLYDDNFGHSWGDVASFFFPESWYKWDSAEHAPSYMDTLNLTSTA